MAPSILIRNGLLVTVDRGRRIITDGAIMIEDGIITHVGKSETATKYGAEIEIDASRMVVTPGFVDAHVHVTTEHLVRGFVPDNMPLHPWRRKWTLPLYAATEPSEEHLSAKFAFAEMIKTGTTCFSEAGTTLNPALVVGAMEELGIRGTVGRWAWDIPPEPEKYAMSCDEALRGIADTIKMLHGKAEGRVSAWACIIGGNTCSDDLIVGAKRLADEYQTRMHMHQSTIQEQVDSFVQEKGVRPIEHFAKIGALGPNLLTSHMVYLSESELGILKQHDTKIVFCPSSAGKLGYGALRSGAFPEAVQKGICVALGCDGANASDTFDMVRMMHLMAGSWKDARANPSIMPAEKVLEMATIDGARALGLDNQIGSLEVGKKADVVLFNRMTPEWNPIFNVVNSLVYSASGSTADTVIVDGRVIMRNRRIDGLDEERLFKDVQRAGDRIIERSGLSLQTRWPVS